MKTQKEKLKEEEIKSLSLNADAIYVYLDAFMDQMSKEEILGWMEVLKKIDPDFDKNEIEQDD